MGFKPPPPPPPPPPASEQFAHLYAPAAALVKDTATSIGFPEDQLVMVSLLLVAILLGPLLSALPRGFMRLAVPPAFGLGFIFVQFGPSGLAYMLAMAAAVYTLVFAQRFGVPPSAVSFLVMFTLYGMHIQRQATDYLGFRIGVETVLMIITGKYISFSYDVYDGARLAKGEDLSAKKHEHDARAKMAVTQLPSPLEFGSFTFAYFGLASGPPFFMKEYLEFQRYEGPFADLPRGNKLLAMASALPQLAIAVVGLGLAGSFFAQSKWASEEVASLSFFGRFLFLNGACCVSRSKYYFAWTLSELGGNACGFGFKSKEEGYGRFNNGRIWRIEFAPSAQQAVTLWNARTSYWLKHYVYLRVERPRFLSQLGLTQKLFATLVTRFTSAFWHGFYPGYFLFFGFATLGTSAEDACRKHIGPYFLSEGAPYARFRGFYTLMGTLSTMLTLNYYGLSFVVLSWSDSIALWKSLYFCGHVLHISALILVPMLPRYKAADGKKTQ
jgi:lysophospholipid acyltransferase